jgi:cell division protein FtsX
VGLARALALALVVISVGCGGREASGPRGCLRVYMKVEATGGQIEAVRHRLDREGDKIASIVFVSREEALRDLRRRHPEMTQDLPYNPLPASFRVTPNSGDDGDTLRRKLRRWPSGVAAVKWNRRLTHC